jgi:DNA-binding response OmpR family regulator
MAPVDPSSHSALVVDEDLVSGWRIAEGLRADGYTAVWVTSQAAAAAQLSTAAYDVVFVSLTVSVGGALDIVRAIRAEQSEAVVFALTSSETEPDVVVALDAGADDVVLRRTELPVLMARIRAALRRVVPEHAMAGTATSVDDLTIDRASRRCYVRGVEVTLRAKELDLLMLLTENQGCVVPRYEVMSQVWDENWSGSTKTLDVTMAGLRRHLRLAAAGAGAVIPDIVTVRGRGYRLDATTTSPTAAATALVRAG